MRKLSPVKAISHAFNSVLTYRSIAVRIGMFWIPVLFLLGVVEILVGEPDLQNPQFGLPVLMQIVSAVVGLLGFCSMAVSWHRFILRDEIGSPARIDAPVLRYAGNSLLIMLIVVVPAVILLVLSQLVPALGVLLIVLSIAGGLIVTRLSVKLPAVALGKTDFGFRDAWKATTDNNWQLLGVFLLNAAVVFGALVLLVIIAGIINAISPAAAQVFLLVADAVLKLFLTLFNASIFTSLYGFFVERRDF